MYSRPASSASIGRAPEYVIIVSLLRHCDIAAKSLLCDASYLARSVLQLLDAHPVDAAFYRQRAGRASNQGAAIVPLSRICGDRHIGGI